MIILKIQSADFETFLLKEDLKKSFQKLQFLDKVKSPRASERFEKSSFLEISKNLAEQK
jgi:hypothetical protein